MAQFTTFEYQGKISDYGSHNVLYVDTDTESRTCKYIKENYKELNRIFQRESLNLVFPPQIIACAEKKFNDVLGSIFTFKTDCLDSYCSVLPSELLIAITTPSLVWWNENEMQFEVVYLDEDTEHLPRVFSQYAHHISRCYQEVAEDMCSVYTCNSAPSYKACEDGCYEVDETMDGDRFFYLLADLFENTNERELFLEDQKMKKEVRRLKNIMKILETQGFGPELIVSMLKKSEDNYPKLIVRDYRVYLEGLPEKEVDLGVRERAFYLLYLRHQEGINYKDVIDYREELTELYRHTSGKVNEDVIRKSISTLIDPTKDNMSIACSKIKKAFCSMLNTWIADAYYIKGEQGENKYISLDRKLVVWE